MAATEPDASMSLAAIHGIAATVLNYGYKRLGTLAIDSYIGSQFGGHFQFLTIQGLAVAWLTMVASLTYDAFPSLQYLKVIKRYLMIVGLPLSLVVSSIYWPLMLFFPHLIVQSMPVEMAEPTSSPIASPELFKIPLTIDLALHAAPACSLVLDFFVFEQKYSKKQIQVVVPAALSIYAILYGLWVEYCAKRNGVFPYPFLTGNELPMRIAIYTGAALFGILSFRLLNYWHT